MTWRSWNYSDVVGINDVTLQAIVIPPSEWNPKMKITVPEEESSPDEMYDKEDQNRVEEELCCSHYTRYCDVVWCDVTWCCVTSRGHVLLCSTIILVSCWRSFNQLPVPCRPLGGIRCDIKALRLRWLADWKRGMHWWPLLCPLQYGLVAVCYVLLLVQLTSHTLHFVSRSWIVQTCYMRKWPSF